MCRMVERWGLPDTVACKALIWSLVTAWTGDPASKDRVERQHLSCTRD